MGLVPVDVLLIDTDVGRDRGRRRLGIRSEIERNPEEQCTNVDLDWLEVDFDDMFPGSNTL